MIDAVFGSYTVFDVALAVVIVLSAIMSLARGFMRELATFGALFAAIIGALCSFILLREAVGTLFPDDVSSFVIDLLVLVTGFVMVYIIVKMIAGKLTAVIQGTSGITVVDRVAGFIFGLARGYGVGVFSVWLLLSVIPIKNLPEAVTEAKSFPALEETTEAINGVIPGIASRIQKALAGEPSTE
ncbi:MAG: CvpA family protein [Hyphomonadaceae bacterium]